MTCLVCHVFFPGGVEALERHWRRRHPDLPLVPGGFRRAREIPSIPAEWYGVGRKPGTIAPTGARPRPVEAP